MTAADVVVVGAGVVGASVAYHLARLGAGKVIVVEREEAPGRGSTGRATGGFRAQYATDVNVRLSLLARDELRRFSSDLGVDPGYRPVGYLWLARSAEELDELCAAHAVQRAAGLHEARLLDPSEIARKNPFVSLDGVLGGAHCPTDGFLRPLEILRGYLEGSKRLGVELRLGEAVVGLGRGEDGRIHTVSTSSGDIAAGAVVDAAGAWAAGVARLAGVDIPVEPLRRQVALTEPCNRMPEDMPLTIFMEDGFHVRVRDGRVLLLWPTRGREEDPFCTSVEPSWLEEIARKAAARFPCLADIRVDADHAWAGLYEMSPDGHALLGAAPGVQNLYLANGSSGHGVMHAPALGKLLAELIVHGAAHSLDISPLRPGRFSENHPIAAPARL
jgi:sarcosine oxidase, subunit beta